MRRGAVRVRVRVLAAANPYMAEGEILAPFPYMALEPRAKVSRICGETEKGWAPHTWTKRPPASWG